MTANFKEKIANRDEITLYCLMGEALCKIQILEDALSHSITLKKDIKHPHGISRQEADNILKKYRSYTLGKAIKLAKGQMLYSDVLQSNLEAFLEERNWLVHKSMDDIISGKEIFNRIKGIANRAQILQRAIEDDLIELSESIGVDMSEVHAEIKRYYNKA